MARQPTTNSPDREHRLRVWQNVAMLMMAAGVAVLVYLAVAHTA